MFHASIPALITPMKEDGAIDFDALRKLVNWHIEQGTDAIVALGTTGEAPTVTPKERTQIITAVVEEAKGRVPIIVGTGTNATASTIELTLQAEELGADAALVVTPYYNKPTQQGLQAHFSAVARAAALPQILYNVPGRTGCDLLPETVAELAKIPNIIGIKEATGSLERLQQLRALDLELDLYSGDDGIGKDFILGGGKGVISVTANVAPKLMHDMCHAALKNDTTLASEHDSHLQGLHQALFVESNPIPVKWAVHKLGLIEKGIRSPLTWLTKEHEQNVLAAMEQAKILVGEKI